MAGKSPVTASDEQRAGLLALADSRDRGEADRARAVLLTLVGWTSSKIAEAFGVREDTVRLWRSDFTAGGVAALKTCIAPGPPPVKSEAALRVVTPLLEEPVADRRNWTIPRLRAEIEAREGVHISRSQLSKALRKKKFRWRRPRHTLKGRQTESEVERVGLRLQLRKQQAEAGDIVLLYGDESEALTHPYLARAWAKSGADLRVPAPGQAKKVAMLGSLDHVTRQLIVHTSPTKRSSDFIAHLEQLDRLFGPQPGRQAKPVVLVEDNGPIHTSKRSLAALAARAHWLTVEWLPKYAPELNEIEPVWRDLKAHHLAHQTFTDVAALDQAIHDAVIDLNCERTLDPLAKPEKSLLSALGIPARAVSSAAPTKHLSPAFRHQIAICRERFAPRCANRWLSSAHQTHTGESTSACLHRERRKAALAPQDPASSLMPSPSMEPYFDIEKTSSDNFKYASQ